MKQPEDKYHTSPYTGMTYRIDEELGKRRKEPMFPEKIARITEIIKKANLRILEKRHPKKQNIALDNELTFGGKSHYAEDWYEASDQ